MFDKSVVLLRLAKLDEYVSRLKRFEPVDLQEYLESIRVGNGVV